MGKKVKPYKPIKKMTRIQEFRVRFASKRNGIIWLRKGVVRYVFYTSIAIIAIITVISSLSYAAIGADMSFLAERLNELFISLILIAIPLAAARAFYGFYPSGSTSKMLFGFVMAIAGAAYTYNCFRGGNIAVGSDWGTVAAGISIDFQFIIIAFWIGWLIWCALVVTEYVSYRKQWIANDYRPVETAEIQERMAFERVISKEEKRVTKLDNKAKKRAAKRAKRKGTTVAEEEAREVAAKEAEVKISEVDEEEGEEEDGEPEEEEGAEVEAELKEEIGSKELEEHQEKAANEEQKVVNPLPSEGPSEEEKKE